VAQWLTGEQLAACEAYPIQTQQPRL
jgi:hypothetical protein